MKIRKFGPPWTPGDDALILKHYRAMAASEIAGLMSVPRTIDAIQARAKRLGARSARGHSPETVRKRMATAAKRRERDAENRAKEKCNPWPKVETDFRTAMRGKSYGGNVTLPGTDNPKNAPAVRVYQGSPVGSSLA